MPTVGTISQTFGTPKACRASTLPPTALQIELLGFPSFDASLRFFLQRKCC